MRGGERERENDSIVHVHINKRGGKRERKIEERGRVRCLSVCLYRVPIPE